MMKKILTAILSIVMTLSFAACSESSSADVSSSQSSSSSEKEAESSSQNDESSTADSSAAEKQTTAVTTTKAPETTTTSSLPEPAASASGLKSASSETFSAQELTISGSPEKCFEDAVNKAGIVSLTASIKTKDIFSPFDDLLVDVNSVAAAKPDADLFIYAQAFEAANVVGGNSEVSYLADGAVFGIGFSCKDEAEAKALFSKVCTSEMRNTNPTDDVAFKKYEDADTLIYTGKSPNSIDAASMCYYRIGNNIYALASMDQEVKASELKNYSKTITYSTELDKLCKAVGAKVLPSSVK